MTKAHVRARPMCIKDNSDDGDDVKDEEENESIKSTHCFVIFADK